MTRLQQLLALRARIDEEIRAERERRANIKLATPKRPPGRPRLDDAPEPSPEQQRRAHARYAQGDRTPATIAGERAYQRNRKRNNRSAADFDEALGRTA